VSRVVPDAELGGAALELAQRLAAGPPTALRFMKHNLNRALTHDLESCLELEAERMVASAQTDDYLEAVRAFGEKRPPAFRGR
jgi:enoyl-CoA hydratase/carnithine racemase